MPYKILTITVTSPNSLNPDYVKSICYNTNKLKVDLASEQSACNFINQHLSKQYQLSLNEFISLYQNVIHQNFNNFKNSINMKNAMNGTEIMLMPSSLRSLNLIQTLTISFHNLKFL